MDAQRSQFAFDVTARRLVDYVFRGALIRIGCVLVIVVALVVDRAPALGWVLVAPAALGVWQSANGSYHERRGVMPRNPFIRWAVLSANEGLGRHVPNVTGLIEGVGCATLAFIGPWLLDSASWRVLAFAAAVIIAISTFSTVFTDPAFYNPDDRPPALMAAVRHACGPLLAGLGLAIALPAGWPDDTRLFVILIGLSLMAVSVRMRETDRALVFATKQGQQSELSGRDLILAQAHGMLSGPLGVAAMRAEENLDSDPETYDTIRVTRSRLQQLMSLEEIDVEDAQLPGSLIRPVRWITRPYGAHAETHILVTELSPPDHDLTRLCLDDLVGNAAKAGAAQITVTVRRDQQQLTVLVADDAGPIPPGAWRAPGSSLTRLARILHTRGGDLTHHPATPVKTITATWTTDSPIGAET